MAIVKNNSIMRGASGSLGDELVIRQRAGKMVYCKRPRPYPPKTATQIANQERFKRANDFAKAAIKDPAKKAYYQSIAKDGQTAFNAAFQDAYHKPAVETTVTKEKIIIKIQGKHRIVKVEIKTPGATGLAIQKNNQWEYKLPKGSSPITVWVYDIAGNICMKE